MILVIGPGPLPAATRIELGHFAPMRWSPWRDSHLSVRSDCLTAFTTAIQEGDRARAMQALAASSDALLREARQLSADASAVMSEVLITVDGVAGSGAEIFATLLHEAVHAVAFERGIKDTSRQGRHHNARFRAIAEELGLETGRDSPFGCSSTALAPGTTALYRETLRALTEPLRSSRLLAARDAQRVLALVPQGFTELRRNISRHFRAADASETSMNTGHLRPRRGIAFL